jgi:hypothetical protein
MVNESLQRVFPISPVAAEVMFEMMLLGIGHYKGIASGVGVQLDRRCRAPITPSQMAIGRDTLRLTVSRSARLEIGVIWDTRRCPQLTRTAQVSRHRTSVYRVTRYGKWYRV